MLFPTTAFAVFFFLVFNLHWALAGRPRARKAFLLCASLFFYGFWSWKFALMLLGSAWVNHAAALRMDRLGEDAASSRRRRRLVIAVVAFNLGLLGFFKYTGFVVADALFPLLRPLCVALGSEAVWALVRIQEEVYPWLARIVLPVGISFFTFQALSYVVDVYRRRVSPARSWIDFANYLAFFPQLVAGPIVRAGTLVPQMEDMPGREHPIEAARAVFLILIGLFKKIVVANWLAARLADPVFAWPERFSGPDLLLGVYGYALQIYCDFSAYSDIAIGAALAHLAVHLAARLPLHPARGLAPWRPADLCQPVHHLPAGRPVAWRGVDVHPLGRVSWSLSVHRTQGARRTAYSRTRRPSDPRTGGVPRAAVDLPCRLFFLDSLPRRAHGECRGDARGDRRLAQPRRGGDPLGRAAHRHGGGWIRHAVL